MISTTYDRPISITRSDLNQIASVDESSIRDQIDVICREANTELDVFADILVKHGASSSFLDEVSHFVKGEKRSSADGEKDIEEQEVQKLAQKAANSLFTICALMQKLNEILTTLRVQNSNMYQKMRPAQEDSFRAQKESHVKKAWFALAGGTLGGLCKVASPAFGDIGKAIMEGISNVFPSVGTFFGTLEDGDISGDNAYEIKTVENLMGQDRDHIAQASQTQQAFWQQLDSILRSLAQTGDATAR
ncbi:MAG: hypothetical protein HY860_04325 [Chlamydiales bacterium]|nr:hypothetical protein [Chlamydiales bacterium]